MTQSQSNTQVYTTVAGTAVQTFTISSTTTGTRTQQIMRYLADDLRGLLADTSIDLADALGIPPEERDPLTSPEELAELICNDIEQMMRDQLITGMHFLLSETQVDPITFKYNLKYHAQYQIELGKARSLTNTPLAQYGGRLSIPRLASVQSQLVILIDWSPNAREIDKDMVSPPRYFFNWYPPSERYDASRLVRYDTGGLGMVVIRTEFTLPGNVPPGP